MNSINLLAQKFAVANGFDLSSKSRKGQYIDFKKHLLRILVEHEKLSDSQAGFIVNRDRVNVLQAVKKHKNYCETEKGYFEKYQEYLAKWNTLKHYDQTPFESILNEIYVTKYADNSPKCYPVGCILDAMQVAFNLGEASADFDVVDLNK